MNPCVNGSDPTGSVELSTALTAGGPVPEAGDPTLIAVANNKIMAANLPPAVVTITPAVSYIV